ncbi:hypothetical protein HII17_17165 [Thalassotalea sp. M1531]|uniref:KfrA N-terminal DNA-binding domain-containing protein n=1 Tax=Thalassotalea algicola TaxID=2716224 RepID=A0A7Y0LGK9_9GAMM|nr:DNA-binding protein [Thalassotalea algicola]NMP33286.1 hypothetical protein [Thalassotalea algicola]
MTIKDEILSIANQLANEGINPSVAKVKARLSESASLPTIINTLKSWQHQPENTEVKKPDTPIESEINVSELDVAITKALQPLKEEIAEIKQLLIAINEKLDC